MGLFDKLFGSKKKITVSSVSTPLIGESPDLLGKAILQSVMGDADLVGQIVEDSLNGGGVKVKRAYRYARDNYTLGLPQGYSEDVNFNEQGVIDIIRDMVPNAFVQKVRLDAGDVTMHGFKYLIDTYQWNIDNDEIDPWQLNNVTGGSYDRNVRAVKDSFAFRFRNIIQSRRTALYREPKPLSETGVDDNGNPYNVSYYFSTDYTSNVDTTLTSVVDDIDIDYGENDDPVMFTYTFKTNVTERHTANIRLILHKRVKLWEPDADTSVDDPISDVISETYTHHPVEQVYSQDIYFTKEKSFDIDLAAHYYFAPYTFMEQHIGFEMLVRKAFLYRVEDGTYPELDFNKNTSVENPFYPVIPMRVNNSDYCAPDRQDTELYQTSKKLLGKMDIDIQNIRNAINDNPGISDIDHAFITFATRLNTDNEAGIEYLARFWEHMYLQYGGDYAPIPDPTDPLTLDNFFGFNNFTIKYTPYTGSGAGRFRIQESSLNILIDWKDITVEFKSGSIGKVGSTSRNFSVSEIGVGALGVELSAVTNDSYVEFRYQIDKDTYKSIKVFNPKLTNYVYQGKTVITDLSDAQSETNNNFLIPLHYNLVNEMGTLQRNELYYDSLQLVFNSYVVTKVKWYQTGFFRAVLTIASIALAIYTGGASLAAFSTILATQGLTAAVLFIIQRVLIAIALQFVFKLAVKAVGAEAAFIIAIVAVTYGVYDLSQNNWTLSESAWAETLLQVANGISSGIEGNIQDGIIELKRDSEVFANEVEAKNAELKAAQDLLAVDGLLDPFQFIRTEPMVFNYESPDNYYNRTVHSGNIGAMSFTLNTNYHDIMLELPKPSYV